MRLLLLAFLALTLGRAEQVCPWLNSATAAGVLDGTVTSTVAHSGVCKFVREGTGTYTLRIEVITMAHLPADFTSWLAQCGPKSTPVRGIGNQAVACDIAEDSEISAQILSRVRERAFLVRVSANKASAQLQTLREQARSVADQVSGNLF